MVKFIKLIINVTPAHIFSTYIFHSDTRTFVNISVTHKATINHTRFAFVGIGWFTFGWFWLIISRPAQAGYYKLYIND